MKNRSLHLAALSACMLLGTGAASSAKLNTDFDRGTDDSPTAKDGTYISDGNSAATIGGGTTAKTEFKHGTDLGISDAAGLHAKNACNIGIDLLVANTSLHAAGLGYAASA